MTRSPSPVRPLPARPNLDYLRKLAKERLRAMRRATSGVKLAAAQLAVAREHGFGSWRALHAHVDRLATMPPVAPTAPRRVAKADWKPIMDAAYRGDAAAIRRLVARGADPNVVSGTAHRYRPLHRAIEFKKTAPRTQRHDEAVATLLELGADPTLRGGRTRMTALQLSATGETRFVSVLLKGSGPLDLFSAAAVCDEKRVIALLRKDRSLAVSRDESGWTPLHWCAASVMFEIGRDPLDAQLRIARKLLDAGADPNAAYPTGQWPIPPLYFACGRNDNPRLTELLIRAGANPCDDESIYHATDEGHDACLAVIERLVPAATLAEECTRCLAMQLHWRHTRGMDWLLAHGADPNRVHPLLGKSALAIAKATKSKRIVERLLAADGCR